MLDEEHPSLTCLDQKDSNRDLNKALPSPPSRIHSVRHSLMTLWYRRLKRLDGYHFGVLCCAVVAAVVLVMNAIFTIWAILSSGAQNGLGTLHDGSCKRIMTLTFWAHLAINVLSTLLLGASNYSMQCLSSPTRNEIDKAHGKGVWLDIGVPSVRNLRWLSTTRIILWWLLAVSSVPLHLLYNSAVFSTLGSHQCIYFLVSSEFCDGAPFSPPKAFAVGDLAYRATKALEVYQKNRTSLMRLEREKCLEVYSAPIISSNSDLLLVSNMSSFTNSLIDFGNVLPKLTADSYGDSKPGIFFVPTLGYGYSTASLYDSDPPEWLQYCLSVPAEEHCKIQFSLAIMLAVILCNLIKTICMSMIAWNRGPEPLVTLGDAIASFLDRPDVSTEGGCIAARLRFEKSKPWNLLSSRWDTKRLRWFQAASRRRWVVCNIL